MRDSEKWFRWSFNTFIFLMCFQMGSLLFLKGILYQAEQRMKDNQAEVDYQCGDFNNDESYWSVPSSAESFSQVCLEWYCPDSYWKNPNRDQVENLHVLSVRRPQPTYKQDGKKKLGHYVDVKIANLGSPVTLVLVSQQMMQWNLKMEAHGQQQDTESKNSQVKITSEHLKEVIVMSPELVWVEGLSEDVKVTYFSKEQACAYPVAWEESHNPENQFRRLFKIINEYTGVDVTTFQGSEVGREFRLPLQSPLLSHKQHKEIGGRNISSQGDISLGIQWERKEKALQAGFFQFVYRGESKTVTVPKKTMEAYYEAATEKIYLINNHRFGYWDWESKNFKPLHLPLKLPNMYWPSAMTFNPLTSELIIYNDDRGGELYSYNVVTAKWKLLAEKVGYSLVALYYDHNQKKLFGARYQGKSIAELVTLSRDGKSIKTVSFEKPLHFSKNQWRAQIVTKENQYWLKVAHPAQPAGDFYLLNEIKRSL